MSDDKSGLLAALVEDLSPDLRRKLAAELARIEGQVEIKSVRIKKPMDLKSKLVEMQTRQRAIERDSNLSEQGKQKKLAALAIERAQLLESARVEYAGEMSRLKRASKALDAKRAEVEESAAQGWDFGRLQYYRGLVESQIGKAQNLGELAEVYSQAARSGDKHLRRAWAEYAPAVIGSKFGGDESASRGDLLRRMAGDLDNLLTTDELREQNKAEAAFAGEVVRLAEQIRAGADSIGRDPLGVPNEFERILAGVRIEERFDSVKFGTYYSVDLEGEG